MTAIEVHSQPVELIVVGCSAGTAEGYANALRNQGQAAHVRLADSLEALRTLLAAARGDIALVDADAQGDIEPVAAVEALRAAAPKCAIILVALDPSAHTGLLGGLVIGQILTTLAGVLGSTGLFWPAKRRRRLLIGLTLLLPGAAIQFGAFPFFRQAAGGS